MVLWYVHWKSVNCTHTLFLWTLYYVTSTCLSTFALHSTERVKPEAEGMQLPFKGVNCHLHVPLLLSHQPEPGHARCLSTGSSNRMPARWLTNSRSSFHTALEAGSPGSWCQHGQVWALFWVAQFSFNYVEENTIGMLEHLDREIWNSALPWRAELPAC